MKINRSNSIRIFAVIVLILAFQTFGYAAPPAVRHNFHTSLTRLDYNTSEKIVEITIQLFTHDLSPLLEKRAGKRIDLEKSPEVDRLLIDYLNQNFIFKDKNGAQKNLVWVGKELEVDTAYVYIQIPLEDGLQGASLQNTIFFESFSEETNLVLSRFDKKKADLLFVSGDKFKEISFEEAAAK